MSGELDPRVHSGAGRRLPAWWLPPDWEAEERERKQREHALEVERQRKLDELERNRQLAERDDG